MALTDEVDSGGGALHGAVDGRVILGVALDDLDVGVSSDEGC